MKSQLLCTFSTKKDIESTIATISSAYTIMFNKIYVLQNEDNTNELICTYNVDVGGGVDYNAVSGTQKGRTTGSKRIVYAVTAEGDKIPIGVKVARTKTGKLGKLQTVYQWSPEMKKCFSKDGKK